MSSFQAVVSVVNSFACTIAAIAVVESALADWYSKCGRAVSAVKAKIAEEEKR
jgi:hypothetical protein